MRSWKGWAVLIVLGYIVVQNAAGSGHFVSHVVSSLGTFLANIHI